MTGTERNKTRKVLLALLLLIAGGVSLTAEADAGTAVVPVAAPFYTPETGYGLGAYTLALIEGQRLTVYGTGTMKSQYSAGLMAELSLRDGRYAVKGITEASRFPSVLWDTGASAPEESAEGYTPREVFLEMEIQRRLGEYWYTGPAFRFCSVDILETETGGLLDSGRLTGSGGSFESGFGWGVALDSRDSPFYPRRGSLFSSRALFYPALTSEANQYWSFDADYRGYAPFMGGGVLAVQGQLETTSGEVPFQSLPDLGGSDILRGLPRGRYSDKTALALQGELRFPLFWRFEGAAFVSAGSVAPRLSDLAGTAWHAAWGGGLRIVVDKANHITARLDAGFTSGGQIQFYFLVNEAF